MGKWFMDGADLSPPTISQLSDPELLHAISWRIDRSIIIGIIIGIQVGNVRRAVNAIVVQKAISF